MTNLRPSAGGADEEELAQAKLRAPGELKSRGRAVTAEDFELLAIETPGALVRRAKALPLVHPKFPDAAIPGVVSVIVVPDSDEPAPQPNSSTLSLVCAYLNRARLLTAEVYVVPPEYRRVQVRAELIARRDADLAVVKRAAQDRLTIFLIRWRAEIPRSPVERAGNLASRFCIRTCTGLCWELLCGPGCATTTCCVTG